MDESETLWNDVMDLIDDCQSGNGNGAENQEGTEMTQREMFSLPKTLHDPSSALLTAPVAVPAPPWTEHVYSHDIIARLQVTSADSAFREFREPDEYPVNEPLLEDEQVAREAPTEVEGQHVNKWSFQKQINLTEGGEFQDRRMGIGQETIEGHGEGGQSQISRKIQESSPSKRRDRQPEDQQVDGKEFGQLQVEENLKWAEQEHDTVVEKAMKNTVDAMNIEHPIQLTKSSENDTMPSTVHNALEQTETYLLDGLVSAIHCPEPSDHGHSINVKALDAFFENGFHCPIAPVSQTSEMDRLLQEATMKCTPDLAVNEEVCSRYITVSELGGASDNKNEYGSIENVHDDKRVSTLPISAPLQKRTQSNHSLSQNQIHDLPYSLQARANDYQGYMCSDDRSRADGGPTHVPLRNHLATRAASEWTALQGEGVRQSSHSPPIDDKTKKVPIVQNTYANAKKIKLTITKSQKVKRNRRVPRLLYRPDKDILAKIKKLTSSEEQNKKESEVSFKCPDCQKIFSTKEILQSHYVLHTGDKPYTCTETGCGRRFKWRSSLSYHHGTHIRR